MWQGRGSGVRVIDAKIWASTSLLDRVPRWRVSQQSHSLSLLASGLCCITPNCPKYNPWSCLPRPITPHLLSEHLILSGRIIPRFTSGLLYLLLPSSHARYLFDELIMENQRTTSLCMETVGSKESWGGVSRVCSIEVEYIQDSWHQFELEWGSFAGAAHKGVWKASSLFASGSPTHRLSLQPQQGASGEWEWAGCMLKVRPNPLRTPNLQPWRDYSQL